MKQHLVLLKHSPHYDYNDCTGIFFMKSGLTRTRIMVKALVLGHLPDNGLEEVGLVGSSSWFSTGRELARIRCRNSASLA